MLSDGKCGGALALFILVVAVGMLLMVISDYRDRKKKSEVNTSNS